MHLNYLCSWYLVGTHQMLPFVTVTAVAVFITVLGVDYGKMEGGIEIEGRRDNLNKKVAQEHPRTGLLTTTDSFIVWLWDLFSPPWTHFPQL